MLLSSRRSVVAGKDADGSRCKVCLKVIELDGSEIFRVCNACLMRICEDCSATYAKNKDDRPDDKQVRVA